MLRDGPLDLSYYSPGTIFCFYSEKKPPVANYFFSITTGGGGGQRWKVWYKMQQKHIDVMHILNNCAFSALQITNKKLKGVIAIKAVFPQLSPHNRAEEERNNYKIREGT